MHVKGKAQSHGCGDCRQCFWFLSAGAPGKEDWVGKLVDLVPPPGLQGGALDLPIYPPNPN